MDVVLLYPSYSRPLLEVLLVTRVYITVFRGGGSDTKERNYTSI